MHESLGKTLSLEDQAPVPSPLTESAQLKHFAREAEVNENFALATKYYQEVCEMARTKYWAFPCKHLKPGHHRPAMETPFKWRFSGGPMVALRLNASWVGPNITFLHT